MCAFKVISIDPLDASAEYEIDSKSDWVQLNKKLIRNKGLTPEIVNRILELHLELQKFFWEVSEMKTITPEDGRRIRDEVEEIEYEMQFAWGFPRNPDFHTHWFRVPGCTCPKTDNGEWVGHGRRIISGDCPIHSVPDAERG